MSKMELIQTEQAPAAVGPYSQAVQMGPWLFTSGQIPMTADGELISGDIEKQTRQVLQNVERVLQAAGLTLDDVVKTTLFITDMTQFDKVNEVYAQFFKDHRPARSCVEVARLPKDIQVEMECIAYRPEK